MQRVSAAELIPSSFHIWRHGHPFPPRMPAAPGPSRISSLSNRSAAAESISPSAARSTFLAEREFATTRWWLLIAPGAWLTGPLEFVAGSARVSRAESGVPPDSRPLDSAVRGESQLNEDLG